MTTAAERRQLVKEAHYKLKIPAKTPRSAKRGL
jgi:hypothetical protein